MHYNSLIIQHQQWSRLQTAFQANRLGHAYLFHGPAGSGKEAHAVELAALVNCHEPTDEGACGHCPSCLKMATFQHPNLHVIVPLPRSSNIKKDDPPLKALSTAEIESLTQQLIQKGGDPYSKIIMKGAQSILINSVRELRRLTNLKATERGWQCFLIFEAERLAYPNHAAANALLKLLEEPPPKTLFVLVTDRQYLLLETIRSRCLGLFFPQLSVRVVSQYLTSLHGLNDDDARILAQVTSGNLAQAREIAISGGEQLEAVYDLVRTLISRTPKSWQAIVNDLANTRRHKSDEFSFRMQLLQLWLRDLMVLQKTGNAERTIFSHKVDLQRRHLMEFPNSDWGTACQVVTQTQQLLERNMNPTLALANMILEMRIAMRNKMLDPKSPFSNASPP